MDASSRLLRSLAALCPIDVEGSDDLAQALSFVGSPHGAETVVRAGYGAGLATGLLVLPLSLTGVPIASVLIAAIVVPPTAIQVVHSYPLLCAAFRRTEALGETPTLVGRIVLRMQVQPALESAVRFAVETGDGPLADDLGAHVDRAMGTPRSGLVSFADEWAAWFPALRRSAHLLATAQDAPEAERGRTLDRSLTAVLDGTRERMATFTSSIQGPTNALFAFGIMLPLALVALVPAVPMVGYAVDVWTIVLVYDVLLPATLAAASLWLLARRPVAFPPPDVGRDHPDVPDRLALRAASGLLPAVGGYLLIGAVGPAHLAPIVALGLGLGVALLAVSRPILAVRNRVRDVEAHLTDALYVVGRQVADGESVESAVALAADRVPAATGTAFGRAAGLQRRLHVGVREAFLGPHGALADVPSSRARGMAALLAIAANEGAPAGRAIVSMADHLEELETVEAEATRSVERVTTTLENTAAYFGPLVAGTTVGMATMLSADDLVGTGSVDAATFPAETLALAVGVYLLTLCVVLVPLSIALRYGIDRALCGYHVGRALVCSTLVYAATVTAVGAVL